MIIINNKNIEFVQQHKKISKYILAALAAVVFVLVVWCVSAVVNSFITVKEISVQGESIYTAKQVIAASGIEISSKRNKIDIASVEEKILDSLSFLSDVDIKIKANGIAIINVTGENISYYSSIAGSFYVMSSEFKLLGLSEDLANRPSVIMIKLPRVKKAIVGSVVEFYDDIGYIDAFMRGIDESFLSDKVTLVDASDRYDLSIECGEQFFIRFGDFKNLDKKIDKVRRLVESTAISDMSMALIDVSDISNSTIKSME